MVRHQQLLLIVSLFDDEFYIFEFLDTKAYS